MNRSIGIAIAGAAFLAGCQDNGLSELENINLGTAPQILVEPVALDFGVVADGMQEIRQFTVTNVGDATLQVDNITLAGDADFTILSQGLTFELAPIDDDPAAVRVIDVAFSPLSDATATGQAIVASNDEVTPTVPVNLTGHSSAPYLTISPDPHDFGTQYVGIDCVEDQVLTLTNEGLEDLTVTGLSYSDPAGLLDMSQSPALPFTLTPGQQEQVVVEFDAWQSGSGQGVLDVTSNDPRGVVSAEQFADTQYALTTSDTFVQPTEVPVDILFAIDQSCSMDERLTNLQDNFSTFISTIDSVTQAWRIGVATLDGGCFNSGFIERTTPNYTSVFNSAVVLGDDIQVTNDEYLFTMADDALNASCNSGFARSGALLHIVFVSDESEQGSMNAQQMWDSAVAHKGGMSSLVKMSGIVCPDVSGGCNNGYSTGIAGEYLDAIQIGGGVHLDITAANWGANVEELATASLTGIGRYELSQPADPNATEVLVDGTPWTDWYYDAATNSIVFTTAPPNGAEITVNYGVAINCN